MSRQISQMGGGPTPLPLRYFSDENASCGSSQAGGGCCGGCGSMSQPPVQMGGGPTPMPLAWFEERSASEQPPAHDFTDMLYRGQCARATARAQVQVPSFQCRPAFQPVPGAPKSAPELIAQERTEASGEGEQQTGGAAVGAPFHIQRGVPGVKGLSYRFNECGNQTGVRFHRL